MVEKNIAAQHDATRGHNRPAYTSVGARFSLPGTGYLDEHSTTQRRGHNRPAYTSVGARFSLPGTGYLDEHSTTQHAGTTAPLTLQLARDSASRAPGGVA